MAINIPFKNHGACCVALVVLKDYPNRVIHFSKTINQQESWALRDFANNMIVRSGESPLTASQLEDLVICAFTPAHRPVTLVDRWKTDCLAISERHFGATNVDTKSPNPNNLGNWRRIK